MWTNHEHWLKALKNLERISIVPNHETDEIDETDETETTGRAERGAIRKLMTYVELSAKPDTEAYRTAETTLVETIRLNDRYTTLEGMDSKQTKLCSFFHATRNGPASKCPCLHRVVVAAAQIATTATLP